jgi:cytidylate kinase
VSARVVTISATYGAGGSRIGPGVAERLGLPFIDRGIPATVAVEIGCSLEEALAHDDRAEHGIGRILAGAARLPNVAMGGMDVYLPDRAIVPEGEFVTRTEQVIKEIAADGGVILGRAGAAVLADHPYALHVRLDGPRAERLARVAAEFRVGQRAAQRMLDDNDRARAAYVKHFYRADPADPRFYHLVIDSTRLPEHAVVELIVLAARAV